MVGVGGANGAGKEFSVLAAPGQPNDLAAQIQLLEAVWFAKVTDQTAAVPSVFRYMYLARVQEWRTSTTAEHTRNQRAVQPPDSPNFPLRTT